MNVEYKENAEQKTVGIVVDGKITQADFDSLVPKMEAFIETRGSVKILEIIRNLDCFEPSVLIDGAKFDMKHIKHFSHCAVVSDKGRIGPLARLASAVS
ncbi:STAS/SEC14 domain-containing protein [Endozoicomonas sp. G2_2]|uniref:STAS/SEC14 domain-containing protein n=1 Tax=Endozoicomonas sp. G2_2 TaxID=2821092 RepID=UPI001ADC20A4|nr:STAS/SEC14 domain-containing protein [Endozoicomonas sp. G2_2]MBO9471386.1 STAS/SEC14 domain-containing protein [Endozoicomonas sp. G2_2]|tara:strand:+ start:1480 stop:1776 length:297 start_codon:yes stop_codon:yes gene_type:complete